jgi:large subunit ribosomal protein L6
MSRLGKKPLTIPEKVKVELKDGNLEFQGPQGKLSLPLNPRITVKIEKDSMLLTPVSESKSDNMLHGLARGLVKNALEGVLTGFKKDLEIQGLGFKASLEGKNLKLIVGFSHPVVVAIPESIKAVVSGEKQTLLAISGTDKMLVGQVSASIRAIKPPEPYQGTGIRYAGEHVVRKAGKAAAGSGAGASVGAAKK